jgi:hypothetical protein
MPTSDEVLEYMEEQELILNALRLDKNLRRNKYEKNKK